MIYLDSSSLLKLLYEEPESEAVRLAIAEETEVIVSPLTQLESRVQLKAAWLGGDYGKPRYLAFLKRLDAFGETPPFRFASLGGSAFSTAIRQDAEAGILHLRVLDRLHLGAMEELGISRLMTHDSNQAAAARALDFETISPS